MPVTSTESTPLAAGAAFLVAHDLCEAFDILIRTEHPRFMAEVVEPDDRDGAPGDINLGERDLTNLQWLDQASSDEMAEALAEAAEFLDDVDEHADGDEVDAEVVERWYAEPEMLPEGDGECADDSGEDGADGDADDGEDDSPANADE
jgi:hypothetical protein